MVKHWRITHPELPTHPKFNIKVVGTYRDALSRQVPEAVRIELRGDEILNSKSEFNRCRLPRLTINRDDWLFRTETATATVIANPIAKENQEGFPAEGGSFQDELGDSALWRIGNQKKAVKRKKETRTDNIPGGRKKKRARLERLENWGETEKECETDVRSWLVTSTETPRTSMKMKQLEMEFSRIGVITIVQSPKPSPITEKEICTEETTPAASMLLTPKPKIVKGGKKLPKKDCMKLIRKTNSKITNWTVNKPHPVIIEDDWSDDISIPDLICTEEIEMKENAKMKADIRIGKRICRDIIMEMISNVESISTASLCMKGVMDDAWWSIKERKIKKLLEDDKEMVIFTLDLILSWRIIEIKEREK